MSATSGHHGAAGDGSRGSGFVHLNTPATIEYTSGQTVSVSALRQRRSRVECVTLPESQAVWRRAIQRHTKEEGYGSFAADVEDERSGAGPILPPLVPQQRTGPVRRRAAAGELPFTPDPFFTATATAAPTADDVSAAVAVAVPSASSLSVAPPPQDGCGGIAIVSHHKVAGRRQFVYPDHDGVLSAGVVPSIVVTAEERAEEEAARAFYVSPLAMSEEEVAAFEELQALWKNRARSHSYLGTQHRLAAKGAVDPSAAAAPSALADAPDTGDEGPRKMPRRDGGTGGSARHAHAVDDPSFTEAETGVEDESALDRELAEALRMADDLLRFA